MDTVILKKDTVFSLSSDLLLRLEEMARAQHRSLNSFVESVLMDVACHQPNEETLTAIEEARSGKLENVPGIDTSSVEAMFKSAGV